MISVFVRDGSTSYRKIKPVSQWLTGFFVVVLSFSVAQCAGSISLQSESPSNNESETDSGTFTIIAIDVGQGDATLFITPSWRTILIDGGGVDDGIDDILPLFSRLGIDRLDYLFVSHYDADHIGGIAEVVAGEDTGTGTEDDILPDVSYDQGGSPLDAGAVFTGYLNAIGAARQTIVAGEQIDLEDGVVIDCLINNGVTADGKSLPVDNDDNSTSMGLLITYEDFRYFTAGDLPADLEDIVAPLVDEVDMLHVNHHASGTSSSEYFLETLRPTVSIISVGDNNTYGHPDPNVLYRLNDIGTEIYQTETGAGGLLPEAHIIDGSIFITVEKNGDYSVNGNLYESKGGL